MQSEFMMIDPNELSVEWEVNDAHVEDLMKQLEVSGTMLSEVLVWLHDMRIIDGFHRTEAAKRLGWKQIPCKVWDCTEEEFWDARIVSAKKHHVVEDTRLMQWMMESWKQTEWFVSGDVFVPKFRTNTQPEAWSMVNAVWRELDHFGVEIQDERLADWISAKAGLWGCSVNDVIQKMVRWCQLDHRMSPRAVERADYLAKKYNLGLEQREAIFNNLVGQIGKWKGDYDEDWVKEEIVLKKSDARPYHQYAKEKNKEHERRQLHERSTEAQKRIQWDQSPAGKAQQAKERKQRHLHLLEDAITKSHTWLSGVLSHDEIYPEGFQMLVKHLNAIRLMITDLYPDSEVKTKANPIWTENIELRQKVTEQAERIASLERALGSAKAVRDRLPDTMAVSSTHFDMQP